MSIYALFINNKHGMLIYDRKFSNAIKLSANDTIILASTFHGLSRIAAYLTPREISTKELSQAVVPKPHGINHIQGQNFAIHCFHTLTGLKFFIITSPALSTQISEVQLQKTYQAFCDYALKNPFHDTEMPIRCKTFETKISKLFTPFTPNANETLLRSLAL